MSGAPVIWYLRSIGDHDTHRGALRPAEGTVAAWTTVSPLQYLFRWGINLAGDYLWRSRAKVGARNSDRYVRCQRVSGRTGPNFPFGAVLQRSNLTSPGLNQYPFSLKGQIIL
jgi:hypothetical protein